MKAGKVIAVALVIFLAGVVSGAMAAQLYRAKARQPPVALYPGGPPAPWLRQRVEFMHHLGRRLSLNPEQRARIDALVLESQQRLRALWSPLEPQAKEEIRHLRRRMAAELRPEQSARFEALLHERAPRSSGAGALRERRAERFRSPAPGTPASRDPARSPADIKPSESHPPGTPP